MTKTPEVSELLDICVTKIAEIVRKAEVTPRELESCVSMLIQVDRNNLAIQSTMGKNVENWGEDKYNAELDKIVEERIAQRKLEKVK